MAANFEQLLDENLSTLIMKQGSLVTGIVIDILDNHVVVHVGLKSEAVVAVSEFYNESGKLELQIGDEVQLTLEAIEDGHGNTRVAREKAIKQEVWKRIEDCLAKESVLKGLITGSVKGGMTVDVQGIKAFLPGSLAEVIPTKDLEHLVGNYEEFKVIKLDKEKNNVVLSRKAVLQEVNSEEREKLLSSLAEGQVIKGVVKNLTDYGAFVDLGGIDGLLHITDLSWGRVNHPEEIVQLDEKIKVVILDFDDNKKRIALGLKQLSEHPWDGLKTDLNIGDKVKGNVVVIADYGAFIEIAPGVEGLVHVSEMSWSQHLRTANDFLKVGDEVEAVVLTLDKEERKMSLGIKQLIPDPWENIESKYPVQSKHNSKVRNFTNFGVFVELEEGIDGLIHISDLSWDKKFKHPSEFCAVGDELEVVVLELDKENRRLSLGYKQLEENPWDVYESLFATDSVHEGTVIKLKDKAGIVSLPYGVEAYCPAKHMKKEDGSFVIAEEKNQFKILEFNKDGKKILVSHTKVWGEVEAKKAASNSNKTSKAVKNINDSSEKTTLGDLDALAALKEKMEKGK